MKPVSPSHLEGPIQELLPPASNLLTLAALEVMNPPAMQET